MSIRSLCNTTADVYKWTQTSDAYGGFEESSDAVYTGMPCRIQPISGTEAAMYRRESVNVDTKLFAPPGWTILESYLVKDAAGKRYEIQFCADIDNMGHHTEVAMREIRSDL